MSRPAHLAAIAAVLIVHFAVFGWLIGRFERIVTDGTECRFPCSAYDPFDPFRGRYLRMSVEAQVPISHETSTNYWGNGTLHYTYPLAVKIEPKVDDAGFSRVVAVAEKPTDEGLWVRQCRVRKEYGTNDTVTVQLPDQYFLNENLAEEGERLLRSIATPCVAVYRVRDGRMVLTGVEVGGRRIEDLIREEKK